MRNSITSSTSDEIQSNDLIADFSTNNSNALSEEPTGSSLESSHNSFFAVTSNFEGAPGDGLISAGWKTVDARQNAQGDGSPFELGTNAQVGTSHSSHANNWGDASSESNIVGETGQSLTIAGSFASASNLSTPSANGIALA